MKRRLKTFLILVAIFLLPTLWLLISHIFAKSAVEKYKAQLRAAGEKLTVDELLPPRVPPEQNGAKLFVQAYPYVHYEGLIDSNPPPTMQMVAPGKAMIGWEQPYIVSQVPVMTNTWKETEQQLKQYGPGLDLLHQAAERPELDFSFDYHTDSVLGPHITKMKIVALLLSAATVSDLNRGQTPSAVTNLHTLVTLVDKWKDERTIISQLVRIAMAAIASTAQWEVLQSTNVTDSQLAMLQHDWESMEFVQSMEQAQEMGRVREMLDIHDLRTSNSPSATVTAPMAVIASLTGGTSNTSSDWLTDFGHATARKTSDILWRTSWSYNDELRALQGDQMIIECMREVETNGFFKDALAERDSKMRALNGANTNWLRNSLNDELLSWYGDLPDIDAKAVDRTMGIEATRRIVIVAIALKRYQLRHGSWPVDLKTLVPDFLFQVPRDPVDGMPLRYRANADGTFTLYSIGSDNTDNGGDSSPSGSSLYWQRAHDWVWPQPATPEEVQQFYNKLQHPSP